MESGQKEKCSKLKEVTSGHKKSGQMKSGQNRKWSKWKVVKIQSGQMEIGQNGKW